MSDIVVMLSAVASTAVAAFIVVLLLPGVPA